jgi:hypothetical protein
MRRSTHTGLVHAQAKCDDCPWEAGSRNALGLAAQHADRHPDHTVTAEIGRIVIYNRKGSE